MAVLFLLPPLAFNLLVAAMALAALWEFYRLAEKTGMPVAKTVGMAFGAVVLLGWGAFWGYDLVSSGPGITVVLAGLLLLVLLSSLAPLFARVDLPASLGGASGTVFGVLSVAFP